MEVIKIEANGVLPPPLLAAQQQQTRKQVSEAQRVQQSVVTALLHLYCPSWLLSFSDTASSSVGGVPAAVDTRSARASGRYAKNSVGLSAAEELFVEGPLSCSWTALGCTCAFDSVQFRF